MTALTLPATSLNTRKAKSFVFGGHIGPQSKKSLEKHVRQILDGPNAKWMLDTLTDMPRYWEAVIEKIPEMAGTVDGARLLADLESWLRHGTAADDSLASDAEIPDIWIGFMMIAIQLDQYWRYLEFRFNDPAKGINDLQAELVQQHQSAGSDKVETVGFCAGMIAAVAVASSHNRQDFEKYGAAALRIGVMMAALVGACEAWSKGLGKGRSVSMATAWRNPKQGQDMARIVAAMPDAYVSVLFDESRATVTSSERLASRLIRQLRAAGITTIPLAFKGQLHTPGAERERHTEALIEICHAMPELQFPDASGLALPTYLDHPEGKPVSAEEIDLISVVLRSILANQLSWSSTVSKLVANGEDVSLIAFGLDRPVPTSAMARFGPKQVHFEDLEDHINKSLESSRKPHLSNDTGDHSETLVQDQSAETSRLSAKPEQDPEQVIAIVGMSVKTAGADDLESFGEMLKTGESQHEVITHERMVHDMLYRDDADADPKRKWYGNFMRDPDAFDHKFFKRSPRESMAIDPQGRLSLQGAYQAVEQSGYFNELATTSVSEHKRRKHVGVYVGLCSFEYEINIGCHPTSAFTATGGLRSFIPGRLSHYFGWTGPAMTVDTACSSSTVALHTACKDLLSGEVPAALCGGVNVLTNLQWTQNLAAGSFISPTGQCKPFDTDADGYCRGDGIAYVFLKKLSTAIADGNMVLGTIRATGVNQNHNSTPLFVPNVPSLSTLFQDVIRKAQVEPRDISLVECHGTGTPVGDPAEYESIRMAVAGPLRDTVVPVGSVKGNVGHTEGASGIVSLIKVLTMMREGFIPAQASFKKMNPHIHAQPSDMMEVVTSLRPWRENRKIALINNYGACGNNSSVVVSHTAHKPTRTIAAGSATPRFPFWISGFDARSIAAYSTVLAPYLQSHTGSEDGQATLADVSFNMKRQSNPNLPQGLIFSCSSLADLQEKLSQAASATTSTAASVGISPVKSERPVILCFGGQVSTFVGLDRALYEGVGVLRHHLDQCNIAITSQGLESIYPDIFSSEPIQDVVKLQTALFAMQYASAKSWIDCGLVDKVVSVVGHSFGEITALCIAGVLSLEDTIKLIAGRAKLVRDAWGSDPGAMMAVEADEALVHDMLKESNLGSDGSAGIACYNGRRSFTVAGSTKAIDAFAKTLSEKSKIIEGIKGKRLNVTNAFHSTLVEGLVDRLGALGKELTFNDPVIPIERATEHGDPSAKLDWSFVGSHMRQPVFFDHAVQRLIEKHPQAIFLEAGSNSTITVMASRAHAQAALKTSDTLHFQSVSITNTKKSFDGLTDAIVALWKQGLRVSFWAHHRLQTNDYTQLLLPPYQFEKSRHWLDLKSPKEEVIKAAQKMIADGGNGLLLAGGASQPGPQEYDDPRTLPLWTFVGFQEDAANKGKKQAKLARFRINTASDKYQRLFSTHVIAQTAPMCPATLEIDMAIETAFSLHPDFKSSGYSAVVRDMISHSPICADSTRTRFIDLKPLNNTETEFYFTIHSVGDSVTSPATEKHAEGRVHLCSPTEPSFVQEFGRYERAVSHTQCQAILQLGPNDEGVEALQGRNVYRAFEPVVIFGEVYQGVRSVVGRDGESAGVVHKRHSGDTWLDVPKADSFGQVAGMYVNLLTDLPASDMYVATGLELTMRSPKAKTVTDGRENGPGVWHVLARHARESDKAYVTDVYIFDAATGALEEIIMGLKYVRVAKATMGRILARVTADKNVLRSTAPSAPSSAPPVTTLTPSIEARSPRPEAKVQRASSRKPKATGRHDLTEEVRNVVANVSGIEAGDMTLDSEMADLGIDSLMGMELAREVENTFKCTLDQAEQMEATNLRQFIACVANALARAGEGPGVEHEEYDDISDSESDDDSAITGEGDSTGRFYDSASDISTPDDVSDFTAAKRLVPSPPSAPASTTDASAAEAKVLNKGDVAAREAEAERLVAAYTIGWESALLEAATDCTTATRTDRGAAVVVTGASGSLGSHLVQTLAERSDVDTVVCINRPVSNVSAHKRQEDALLSRGIKLSPAALAKLRVYDTDTSKPQLGLPAEEYAWVAEHGTHIIHNAWPMSGTRPLKAYEPQIRVMRNLLDLARDVATKNTTQRKIGFQLVSSIGVVGFSDGPHVLEQSVPISSVMPSGYNEGKWVCERMLTETLRRHPSLFQASVCRPGQISGSTTSGVWNPVEHFPFLVKSAQALKAWPDLQGDLHWLPVDRSAGTMVDLLRIDDLEGETEACPVYHIDNPIGQPWKHMSTVLASALDIPSHGIIPFREWVERVRRSSLSEKENPAARVIGFLEGHFERMACGGIILDTRRAEEHSGVMKAQGRVSDEVVRGYVRAWKESRFLD
ncbi:putative polyketide synthase [Annulohypoxylon maeteangense]|uniref:putative polyketide synthase n=1 Tax=Annulohypoxylon maeteangense TaxID=1927788 RepID=UPI002008D5F2|nr:putative polyketide synthase [Annulohypoxylon maeteangense]KAI0881958.1 putative polyketide synthase [Annulohypoxylon maeteangense]